MKEILFTKSSHFTHDVHRMFTNGIYVFDKQYVESIQPYFLVG